jgi:(1->4)-alpha-D-glucan 1-alpha-D-glucosylmutase
MAGAIPRATYRVQFTKDFGFDDAAAIVPYLKALGISHLYASPFLKARPGSTHGYDIVDHEQLNPELGGDEAFARLSDALKQNGISLILDFVPNHMGVGRADNAWWLDVLEWGQKSPHAASFDIDWEGLTFRRHPGVLLPILGRPYGDALRAGEIELKYDAEAGSFAAWYFENKLPINPQRYGEMLRTIVGAAAAESDPVGHELLGLAHAYRDPNTPAYRDASALKQRLKDIAGAAALIERGLSAYHGATEAGAALLHRLLERQHYRVAYWRVAFSAVNYRRFFDINELAGIRVEHPPTFRAVHGLVGRLIADDTLQGLRLDHIDGLREPARYTANLQRLVRKLRRQAGLDPSFYILVEKILGEGEPMPPLPGVDGTTGYEWLNTISRVLVDGDGLAPLETTWRDFTAAQTPFTAMLEEARHRVINTMLTAEFNVLANALARIAAGHFSTRDFTLDRLRAALELYVIEFPVYRSYVTAAGASDADRAIIDGAIGRARARWRGPDPEIFDFLRDAMTTGLAEQSGYSAPRVRNFALKLQQFTGPLMAKSLEDTTFYRHHRLLALNEVGGEPAAAALPLADFHRQMAKRADSRDHSLTATATHDTKRGEDGRARILALAEMPQAWDAAVREWRELNAPLRSGQAPSRSHEYMLYQALIGAWTGQCNSEFADRMAAFALKAAREGKEQTSWTNPDEDYEKALDAFVRMMLDEKNSSAFLKSFGEFAQRPALIGALNALSQLTLKAMLPGVPDFYQGTELWDFSLVDPDNRRPVDFEMRQKTISQSQEIGALAETWGDGHVKFALTRKLLAVRAQFPQLFELGSYRPIEVAGAQAGHVIAFARQFKRDTIVVAAGRHFAPLTEQGLHWPGGIQAELVVERSRRWQDLLADNFAPSSALDLKTFPNKVPVAVWRAV